ncbi:hypothetical protein BJ875DRAFT_442393 [Amylocarpus encephaloides]|uniref:Uncharacterized protein n=1 Tax=Amylocarpus encephaloides TaxID=45428 RepID=A0A9P7YG70_9HELO|nr:hypothetical protein BJ875DRAFT_442393 [Amylocarpus encephaloides]
MWENEVQQVQQNLSRRVSQLPAALQGNRAIYDEHPAILDAEEDDQKIDLLDEGRRRSFKKRKSRHSTLEEFRLANAQLSENDTPETPVPRLNHHRSMNTFSDDFSRTITSGQLMASVDDIPGRKFSPVKLGNFLDRLLPSLSSNKTHGRDSHSSISNINSVGDHYQFRTPCANQKAFEAVSGSENLGVTTIEQLPVSTKSKLSDSCEGDGLLATRREFVAMRDRVLALSSGSIGNPTVISHFSQDKQEIRLADVARPPLSRAIDGSIRVSQNPSESNTRAINDVNTQSHVLSQIHQNSPTENREAGNSHANTPPAEVQASRIESSISAALTDQEIQLLETFPKAKDPDSFMDSLNIHSSQINRPHSVHNDHIATEPSMDEEYMFPQNFNGLPQLNYSHSPFPTQPNFNGLPQLNFSHRPFPTQPNFNGPPQLNYSHSLFPTQPNTPPSFHSHPCFHQYSFGGYQGMTEPPFYGNYDSYQQAPMHNQYNYPFNNFQHQAGYHTQSQMPSMSPFYQHVQQVSSHPGDPQQQYHQLIYQAVLLIQRQ